MPLNELILYLSFVIGFAITPGPNMMLYLAHTFEYGRKAGWATVAGITSAFLFHIAATVLGLSALLMASPQALDYIRYAGITYLLFLAWRNLRTVQWNPAERRPEVPALTAFYTSGLIGNLLNPGTALLYFSLIPQFIHPERQHVLTQNLVLCGWQMLGSTVVNSLIVFGAGFGGEAFCQNERYQRRIRVIMSLLLAAFALKMLFWKN